MRLTLHTDYALRVLIYLALEPQREIPTHEISSSHGISPDHVAKAAKTLTRAGYVAARRGRQGGLRLARSPSEIKVGAVVRVTETTLSLLDCFEAEEVCRLSPACRLKPVLLEAGAAFFEVLDRYSLQDLIEHPRVLRGLLPTVDRQASH